MQARHLPSAWLSVVQVDVLGGSVLPPPSEWSTVVLRTRWNIHDDVPGATLVLVEAQARSGGGAYDHEGGCAHGPAVAAYLRGRTEAYTSCGHEGKADVRLRVLRSR